MSWSEPDESCSELDALVELGRKQGVQPSAAELDAGLQAINARLEAHRTRRRRLTQAAPLVSLALAAGIVFAVGAHWFISPVALTYEVEGGSVLDAGYLHESNGKGVEVTFEEGTKFTLASGARARLRSVDARGARLGLERGKASFHVTPDVNRRWEVEVGPFLVEVKGTVFDVNWNPEVEQFELELEHGRVLVTGPVSGGALTLSGGQRLVVHLAKGETRITDARAGQLAATAHASDGSSSNGAAAVPSNARAEFAPLPLREQASKPLASDSTPEATATEPAHPAQVTNEGASVATPEFTQPQRKWVGALARGQWARIVHEAETEGIPSVLATASSEQLFALANAARYRQRAALARDALLALRQRFPGSGRAIDAAFLLGRVAESRGEDSTALSWYDDYLSRAANSTYAAEALGRKMTMLGRSFGAARARPVAEEYLRRYPKGSYAGSARALLASP